MKVSHELGSHVGHVGHACREDVSLLYSHRRNITLVSPHDAFCDGLRDTSDIGAATASFRDAFRRVGRENQLVVSSSPTDGASRTVFLRVADNFTQAFEHENTADNIQAAMHTAHARVSKPVLLLADFAATLSLARAALVFARAFADTVTACTDNQQRPTALSGPSLHPPLLGQRRILAVPGAIQVRQRDYCEWILLPFPNIDLSI